MRRSDSAPVAQLDRVSGYEPEGRAFESLRARQLEHALRSIFGLAFLLFGFYGYKFGYKMVPVKKTCRAELSNFIEVGEIGQPRSVAPTKHAVA